jgi:hypothetical protein
MSTETKTVTKVETEVKESQPNEEAIIVEAPLFILFAEYLGYVSIFNKMAEDWCDGKVPEMHIQKIIILEAKCILRQMKKDYGLDSIREFYSMYYPLIFQEYDENLAKLIEK